MKIFVKYENVPREKNRTRLVAFRSVFRDKEF